MLIHNTTMQTMPCCVTTVPDHSKRTDTLSKAQIACLLPGCKKLFKSIAVPVQYYCHHMLTVFPAQVGHVESFMLYFLTSYCFMLNLDFKWPDINDVYLPLRLLDTKTCFPHSSISHARLNPHSVTLTGSYHKQQHKDFYRRLGGLELVSWW